MPPSRLSELLSLDERTDGLVTAREARDIGIVDSVLARLTQRENLERVARKVYRTPLVVRSFNLGGNAENLSADGIPQIFRQGVRLLKAVPGFGGALDRFDRDLPKRACRNARRIRKMAHLVGCDFGKAAAVAEAQGQRVARNDKEALPQSHNPARAPACAGRDKEGTSS